MRQPVKRLLFWMPRILGILVAAFVSIFAFDVFGEGYTVWETIAALARDTLLIMGTAENVIGIPVYLLRKHFDRKHGPGAYYGQR